MRITHDFEHSKTFGRLGVKAMGCAFTFVLFAVLITARVITGPALHFRNHIAGNIRENKKKKGLSGNGGLRPGAILSISGVAVLIWVKTTQAQSQMLMTNATFDSGLTLKPSNPDIWQNGIGEGFKRSVQSVSFSASAGHGFK